MTMEGLFQLFYLHSVWPGDRDDVEVEPHPPHRKAIGERINITWRWIKQHTAACPCEPKIPPPVPQPTPHPVQNAHWNGKAEGVKGKGKGGKGEGPGKGKGKSSKSVPLQNGWGSWKGASKGDKSQ